MEKAPVRIALLHTWNTFNNGSFMMLVNFIHYFSASMPPDLQAELWMEMEGRENRSRLSDVFSNGPIPANVVFRFLPFRVNAPDQVTFAGKVLNLRKKFFSQVRFLRRQGISAVIILGGDDISEYYKKWTVVSDLLRIRRYTLHFKTILAGQTIGPFSGIRKKTASWCLSRAMIYTRDPLTTKYVLHTLGHPSRLLADSVDLAIADLPGQPDSTILKRYNLSADAFITLVPGGFITLYTRNANQYLACWKRLVEMLADEQSLRDKKIVLLPHVTRPEDDRVILSALRSMPGRHSGNLCFIEDELLPRQLRTILGSGYFTISSRMHASVSTFQQGKPALSIGYSVKYDGVIGRVMGFPELVIQGQGRLFDGPDHFAEAVLERIRYVVKNYTSIREKISATMPGIKQRAVEQVRNITEYVLK